MRTKNPSRKSISEKDRKLIENIVSDLKKVEQIESIILFGSYSKGRQKPISDIDICVLTKEKISNRIKSDIGGYSSRKIDISLFWDLPVTVRYSVLREGKPLFNKSQKVLHDATVRTMSEYLDFKHIIDRNIARVFGS